MIAVVQTFSDDAGWNPHIHALGTRGGWDRAGTWVPVPFVDGEAATLVFRHKVFAFLQAEGLLSEERTRLLLSWRHSGFSVHNTVTVPPDDRDGLERLARYLLRAPISLERLSFDAASDQVAYARRARETAAAGSAGPAVAPPPPAVPVPTDADARALRRRWAQLIRRIYEADPLVCPRCGEAMRIMTFVTEPKLIDRILKHLAAKGIDARSPPTAPIDVAAA